MKTVSKARMVKVLKEKGLTYTVEGRIMLQALFPCDCLEAGLRRRPPHAGVVCIECGKEFWVRSKEEHGAFPPAEMVT